MERRHGLHRTRLQRWADLFLHPYSQYTPDPDRGPGPGYQPIPHQLPEPDLGRLSQLPRTKRRRAYALDHHAGSAVDIDLRSMLRGHKLCPHTRKLLRLLFMDEGSTNDQVRRRATTLL